MSLENHLMVDAYTDVHNDCEAEENAAAARAGRMPSGPGGEGVPAGYPAGRPAASRAAGEPLEPIDFSL
ncbi:MULTISPECIES: hypothetical protein [Actinomadura]|uniref:hypothetical protein n=1 Tax=Actinomadura TaxID=1988 RepID=UPI0026202FB6|nr:hypothetical protein [Actinomadura geliboluensis]